MEAVFVDANYLIALLNPKDDLHQKAVEVSNIHGNRPQVTTDLVLIEVLNGLAGKGGDVRRAAVLTVEAMRNRARIRVIPQTTDQFVKALDLYKSRQDKAWGLVDCASFRAMQELELRDALTHDIHFEQAGFRALLRDREAS